MTIKGKAALGRAVGLMATALLVAACGAPAPVTPSAPADTGARVDDYRVHADSLDTATPAPYGSIDVEGAARPGASARTRAPEPSGPCPDSGMRITAGDANAAMGLRALTVTLTNCGRATFDLYGYPRLKLLDADGTPVERVQVLEGTSAITAGVRDDTPRRITVRPGEAASTSWVWRNTYDDTTHPPVTVARVVVDPALGRGTQAVTPDPPLDLGSTGRLGTTAWRKR
ncbi:DUF4232 domain-containing protein [Streptomyces sp. NPDC046939]|uniref:DUF4232 domain-containing protein n=1 Tax=Streptomyces sp. NPDC046939 TaxID=3155376 RepID=UPI00340B4226